MDVTSDIVWVVVCGALVFFMQAGFLCLEVGAVRPKAATITALKNVIDWLICTIFFFFFGWGLMFGQSGWHGLFGTDGFMLKLDASLIPQGLTIGPNIHFLFELAFAGTAATIVSGALAERASFYAYMIFSAAISAIIYPVAGHWIWGNSFFPSNQTHSLLAQYGFIDFAGSTVVHSIGGWCALMGAIITGPRLGRFGPNGEVRHWETTGAHFTALGVLILWIAWWGFNGGSTLRVAGKEIGSIIINTNLAGACGGLGSILYYKLFHPRFEGMTYSFLNGILGGLVSVTASCFMIGPIAAVIIGLIAGFIVVWGTGLLMNFRIDDPVGAIPVHLFCGIWGTLCVAFFGSADVINRYAGDRLLQLGVQITGIVLVGIWCIIMSAIVFWGLKRWIGLRVSPHEEIQGYDIAGAYPAFATQEKVSLTDAELRALFGEDTEDK